MAVNFLLTLSMLFLPTAFSENKDDCSSHLTQIANELIELELAGNRASSTTACLDAKNFKWIQPYLDSGGENPHEPTFWISKGTQPRVQKIFKIQGETARYEVSFQIKTKNGELVKDRLHFELQNSSDSLTKRDCANLLLPPKVALRRVGCVSQ